MNLQDINYKGKTYEADLFTLETDDTRTVEVAEIIIGAKAVLLKRNKANEWVKHIGYLSEL
jgi:hypothetical protein